MIDPVPVAIVSQAPRAGLLLKPLRLRILDHARVPCSAAAIAAALGLSRQKVNYHVRELARGGFLRRAGRRRKRGLVEQKYVVTARAFLLGPEVLGPMGAGETSSRDRMSAAYLLALAAQMQRETARASQEAHAEGKRLPVLSLDAILSFAAPEQRARFAAALASAVSRAVAEHGGRAPSPEGHCARRFRLVVGCYPIPGEDRS